MIKTTQSTRGLTLVFNLPSSPEEFDKLAGPGQCLANANAQVVYRSGLPKVWKAVCANAATLFGIERPQEVEGNDADGNPIMSGVDDASYLKAIKDQVDSAALQSAAQSIIDSWNDADIFQATSRSKKPDKTFYAKAEQFAARVAAGTADWSTFEANSAARGAVTPLSFDAEGNVDIDTVALRLQEVALADDLG